MKTNTVNKTRLGIKLRTALLSWLVTIVTLLIFVIVIIPEQKQTFLENLDSKAHGVAVSLRDVAAGAVVNADFSTVVDHCMQILNGDKSIDYIVITRNDGFSLLHDRSGWRQEDKLSENWHPAERSVRSGIDRDSMFNRRVFHYSQPFDYSGIEWGWIHVGLTLDSYDRSVATVYWRTSILAVICIVFSFVASIIYARRLVQPILVLRTVVQKIAGGDLSTRAIINTGDELGSLAGSVNKMTEALLKRDKILQSVRFAAQRFLSTPAWNAVIEEVLMNIGQAASVSRVYVFVNHLDEEENLLSSQRYEWVAAGIDSQANNANLQGFPWYGEGFDRWADLLERGELISASVRNLSKAERDLLEPQGIKSLLLVPIMVENAWWGFLGLDECLRERDWTDAEQDSLRAAADMLGAAIAKQQTQDALLNAKEAAEAASKAKSQFLANMSHELRTPLNHIIGFTELVVDKRLGSLGQKQEQYLGNVLQSSRHLLSLVNDILDLSKVEAGKLELEPGPVNFKQLLENSLVMVKEKAMRHGIQLSFDGDGIPEEITADDRKLKQILYNLLFNAVKFTPDGGRVRLAACMAADEGYVEISVTDTGIGIKSKDLKRIFDPFEQADGSSGRKYEGTGLGLSLTRKLVELHGGRIWAESDGKGRGSRFSFNIPLIAN